MQIHPQTINRESMHSGNEFVKSAVFVRKKMAPSLLHVHRNSMATRNTELGGYQEKPPQIIYFNRKDIMV